MQRPDHNDISLAIVPRDHPLIPYASLEAEGHGLLDRLLDLIHGDHRLDKEVWSGESLLTENSDGLLVTGTLNSLGMLVHRRPAIMNKILNSVLNFNPLKLASLPLTPSNKVIIKSIERTTRALLLNIMKRYFNQPFLVLLHRTHSRRNNDNPNIGRMQQFLERMHRARVEYFDETNRKRPAPTESFDGLDQAKRQKLVAEPPSRTPPIPALPPGPVSWRQLFTLNPEGSTVNFDVQNFKDPEQLLRILVPVLQSVDSTKLEQAASVCTYISSTVFVQVPFPVWGLNTEFDCVKPMGDLTWSITNIDIDCQVSLRHLPPNSSQDSQRTSRYGNG